MSVTEALGWLAAGVRAGTKPSGQLDLALVWSEHDGSVAGAFTTSRVPAAHILACRPLLRRGRARGVVVSAGVANAFTGKGGVEDAQRMCRAAERACGAGPMLTAATGTIGPRLPLDAVLAGIEEAARALSREGGEDAAQAILTTDRRPKTAVRRIEVGGRTVTVGGMAKGAGMIAPRMEPEATLLAFLTTDGSAPSGALREVLARALPTTLNAITVDACMSTSDTVFLFANGASECEVASSEAFARAVREVLAELAYAVVADGEGATRVIRVVVSGARTESEAREAAREVASSALLRSALWGSDPNFGRVVQAVGQAPVEVDPLRLRVAICGVELSVGGCETGGRDEAARRLAAGGEARVEVDLGLGAERFEFLTCDLTPDYVRFNAEYTT